MNDIIIQNLYTQNLLPLTTERNVKKADVLSLG